MTIIYAIIIFALLIFVHEFGHLMAAKSTKIKVNEFALGMGPKLFGFGIGETFYSLRAFPIGGFCKMEGEDEDSEDPNAFGNRPMWARALTLFAGSLMNILLAILILSIVIFAIGEPTTKVEEITKGSAVAAAGLEVGDTILSLDDQKIKTWSDVSNFLTTINEQYDSRKKAAEENDEPKPDIPEVRLQVRRADRKVENFTSPLFIDESNLLKLGVSPAMEQSPGLAFRSIGYGAQATWNMTKMMYGVLGKLVSGKTGMDQLTGVVGIVKAVGDGAERGFIFVLQLMALISLNLGIVNLLPLPALDGGRLVFLVIRRLTGKRISDETEGRIHLVGFVLLIGLMIYITFIDVNRFILK